MLTAIGGTPDDRTVVLGLSNENLRRLRDDKPILVDLAHLGLPGLRVVIFYGPTEEQMEAQLQPLLRPGAERRTVHGPGEAGRHAPRRTAAPGDAGDS